MRRTACEGSFLWVSPASGGRCFVTYFRSLSHVLLRCKVVWKHGVLVCAREKTQMVCCVLSTVVATFLSLALEADLGLRFSVSSSQEPSMRCRLPLRVTSSTLESVVNAIDLIHLSTTADWAPVRRQQFREGRMTLLEPPEMLLLPFHKF